MSFRGRRIPRVHENDNASKVSTIENTQQLLRILLRELTECQCCRQSHLNNLRNAIISEEVTTLAAEEILEDKMRLGLLK